MYWAISVKRLVQKIHLIPFRLSRLTGQQMTVRKDDRVVHWLTLPNSKESFLIHLNENLQPGDWSMDLSDWCMNCDSTYRIHYKLIRPPTCFFPQPSLIGNWNLHNTANHVETQVALRRLSNPSWLYYCTLRFNQPPFLRWGTSKSTSKRNRSLSRDFCALKHAVSLPLHMVSLASVP